MSGVSISAPAISAFVAQLPPKPSTSTSHLPTILPLAFPTPTHLVNTLTVLHLVQSILSHPTHTSYFVTTSSDPSDTAIRGVLGLYLSSGEAWTADNLLGTEAWKKGRITEEKITEIFGIETTQEKEHETLKGVRVGGRWEEGAKLSESLVTLFKTLGDRMDGKAACVGEVVKEVISRLREETDTMEAFANACCEEAIALIPSLADPYSTPETALSSAPLKLLQDLALRQDQSNDLDLPLPSPAELADISPLPLPLGVLLQRGILVIPPEEKELSEAIQNLQLDSSPPTNGSSDKQPAIRPTETVTVETKVYASLQAQSVQACSLIREEARTDGKEITFLDVLHICKELERGSEGKERGLHIVTS